VLSSGVFKSVKH